MAATKKSQYIRDIYYHWNQTGAINHRKLTPRINRAISGALGEGYTCEEIIQAIKNYDAILKSDKHFWTYRWTLKDFLHRGLDRFLTDSDPFSNFRKGGIEVDETPPTLTSPPSPTLSDEEKKRRLRLLNEADEEQKKLLITEWTQELKNG